MSLVTPQPIPTLTLVDWGIVFAGLGIGCGTIFEILNLSLSRIRGEQSEKDNRVFNLRNFWLILSGVIHCWIEFSFVFCRDNPNALLKNASDLYAAADYRYGNYNGWMESGTTAMEAITALIVGPLCFLVALAATHNHPLHHPLQTVLCTMQLYGLAWFTLQPIFSETGIGGHFSSDPLLFWLVAVGCNAPWAIFPSILLYQSLRESYRSFSASQRHFKSE